MKVQYVYKIKMLIMPIMLTQRPQHKFDFEHLSHCELNYITLDFHAKLH